MPDADRDLVHFKASVARMFRELVQPHVVSSYRNLLAQGPIKPKEMSVLTHLTVLQNLSQGIRYLTEDPAIVPLTDNELKLAFFNGSPAAWQSSWRMVHCQDQDPQNQSIAALTTAFTTFEQNSQAKEEKERQKVARKQGRSNDDGAEHNKRYRYSNTRGRGRGRARGYSTGTSASITQASVCHYADKIPTHKGHKWEDCIFNPNSPNFDKEKLQRYKERESQSGNYNSQRSNTQRSTNNRSSTNKNRPQDQHAMEVDDDGNGTTTPPEVQLEIDQEQRELVAAVSEFAEPLPQQRDAVQAVLTEPGQFIPDDIIAMRNSDRTVPGESQSHSCTTVLPVLSLSDPPHHLDVLFRQLCNPLIGPAKDMEDLPCIQTPTSILSFRKYDRSTDLERMSLTSLTSIAPWANIYTSKCLGRDALVSSFLDPDSTFMVDLDAYDAEMKATYRVRTPSNNISSTIYSTSSIPDAPLTLLLCRLVGGVENSTPWRCLLDSGSDKTSIHSRVLKAGMIPHASSTKVNTTIGVEKNVQEITLSDIVLPEFSRTKHLSRPIIATLFHNPESRYDIILGRDVLHMLGIKIDFGQQITFWEGSEVAFRHRDSFHDEDVVTCHLLDLYADDEVIGDSYLLDSKYDKVDVEELISKQSHLTKEQQNDLLQVWHKCEKLFSGGLGTYEDREVHLDLKPDAHPVHQRPYSVPHSILDTFKKELYRLVELGVLEPTGASQWAAPHFATPKKDGRIRMISDFRTLNANLFRRVYPLPRIDDVLRRRSGYKYFTKLDISMQYYTFKLDKESSDLCVIVTPFGKFKYLRLPMGIKQSPDVAQEIMEEVLKDFRDDVEVYIDDIGIFSNDWKSHILIVHKVLARLQEKGFTVNPLKCEWAVQETDWLGHWLTPTGLKPWRKKVDAILALDRPKTIKDLRHFIGAVNFYRQMYPHRAHLFAPLTAQSGKSTLNWTSECQTAFEAIKSLLAQDVFVRYPDHNKPFHVYTDASDYQLGTVIMQDDIPVAYFSRKLNPAQRRYTTMEKELLSIVESLKEYRSMLFGCAELHIHTDHRNLTYANFNSQRVLRWRLYLEEYNPIFHYVKGPDNVIADALSRLPLKEEQSASVVSDAKNEFQALGKYAVFRARSTAPDDDPNVFPRRGSEDILPMSSGFDDYQLLDVYLNHPTIDAQHPMPIDYKTIEEHQQTDQQLLQALQEHPIQYSRQPFPTENPQYHIICYRRFQGQPWRIRIPDSLLAWTVNWYHLSLNHLGSRRLRDTILMHSTHPNLQHYCEAAVQACKPCRESKTILRHYGELPAREVRGNPWADIAIDLIGPWKVTLHGQEFVFQALTIIDLVTNFPEIIRVNNRTAYHVGRQLENAWLSRYPRPVRCQYDQGGEFIGLDFTQILQNHGIKEVPLTAKNPQANALLERLHLTVANVLRTLVHFHQPNNLDDLVNLVDSALQTAAYSARVAIHGTLKHSPGSLAFHRDMLYDIPLIADMETVRRNRQLVVDERTRRANLSRVYHDYAVGDRVYLRATDSSKLDLQVGSKPMTITRVHTNGTVTVQRGPYITERLHIRRLIPAH